MADAIESFDFKAVARLLPPARSTRNREGTRQQHDMPKQPKEDACEPEEKRHGSSF